MGNKINIVQKMHTVPAKKYTLCHPLNGVVSVATQTGYWRSKGRVIGLILQFSCGHVASLSFGEIRELQEKMGNE